MENRTFFEKRFIKSLVTKYWEEGYEVTEAPQPEQLPDFLSGYHPDLLLCKLGRSVVVRVKDRAALADNSWSDMAKAVRAEPGWNFELAIFETGKQIDAPEEAIPFGRETISHVVAEAEQLLSNGLAEAALLRIWSAAEAAVRSLTEEEGWLTDRPIATSILSMAVQIGGISIDEHKLMLYALPLRNAIAHGLTPPVFDDALVDALIGLAKRLLELLPLD